MSTPRPHENQEATVSFADMIHFLVDRWQTLAVGALIGLVVAVGWALWTSHYKAEAVVLNGNAYPTTRPTVDFVTWKYLKTVLPELAMQRIASSAVTPDEIDHYKNLANPEWWEKNVVPHFAFSKDDSKRLIGAAKELGETAGSTILYFVFYASANDKETAAKGLQTSVRFLQSASTYWSLRSFVRSLDADLPSREAQLLKNIGATEIERSYLLHKAREYDVLRKRYPTNGSSVPRQIVDVRDGGARFLPLETQLVAINTDILNKSESLARMRDQLKQIGTTKEFVRRAMAAFEDQADGFAVGKLLTDTIADMRTKVPPQDEVARQALREIESDVASLLLKFGKGFRVAATPDASRTRGVLKWGSFGLLVGGTLAVILTLAQSAWRQLRRDEVAQRA